MFFSSACLCWSKKVIKARDSAFNRRQNTCTVQYKALGNQVQGFAERGFFAHLWVWIKWIRNTSVLYEIKKRESLSEMYSFCLLSGMLSRSLDNCRADFYLSSDFSHFPETLAIKTNLKNGSRGHTHGVSVALLLLQCLFHLYKVEYFPSVIHCNHLEAMDYPAFDMDGYCQRKGTHSGDYNNRQYLDLFQSIQCSYLNARF